MYRIAGIFRGWKLSRISWFRGNSWKFWPRKFSSSTAAPLSMGVSLSFLAIRESFNHENSTFSNSQKFSPTKDSRYAVCFLPFLVSIHVLLWINPYVNWAFVRNFSPSFCCNLGGSKQRSWTTNKLTRSDHFANPQNFAKSSVQSLFQHSKDLCFAPCTPTSLHTHAYTLHPTSWPYQFW